MTDIADTFVALGLRETDPIFIHAGSAPKDAIDWILAAVKNKGARLVIIDVLQKLCRFENINDYSEVTTKMEPLLEAARAGNCHVMTLHHAKKDSKDDLDAAIGSTAIRGLAYTYLFVKRLANSNRRILSSDQRGGKNFAELGIGFDNVTGRLRVEGTIDEVEIEEARPQIIKFLEAEESEVTEKDIRQNISMRGWVVGRALRALVKQGDVERTGTGKKGNAFRYSLATPLFAESSNHTTRSNDTSPNSYLKGNGTSGLESRNNSQVSDSTSKNSSPNSSDKLRTSGTSNAKTQKSGLESELRPDGWEVFDL